MTNGRREGPITDEEIGPLLELLGDFPVLMLAVSGGADSMALLHLVARWRDQLAEGTRPEIYVATVDHGLRPESRREAEFVAEAAAAAGFSHDILTWTGEKPQSGVQAAAREARLRLLAGLATRKVKDYARRHGRGDVELAAVTAHTLDDQAETVLMRLARGSGIQGLSGMHPCVERDGLFLLRPLLGTSKVRLVATLQAVGKAWIEDPSNEDHRFERARWREARPVLESLGLTAPAIARSARRLQRVQMMVSEAAGRWIADFGDMHGGAYASLRLEAFENGGEVALRGLQAVMQRLGGEAASAELSQVETVYEGLCEAAKTNSDMPAVTVGGCIIDAIARRGAIDPVARVFREAGNNGLSKLELGAGETGLWDRRFRIVARQELSEPILIEALGHKGWANLKRERPDLADLGLPARAAATLPAIRQGEKLVAVPYLGGADLHLAGRDYVTEVSFLKA